MLKICFKIWAVANLLVLTAFAFLSFPKGLLLGANAVLYSAPFSLPAIPVFYFLLKFLRFAREGVAFSWVVLLLATSGLSFLAYYLYVLLTHATADELSFALPLSFVSGFSAVLFFSPVLHYLFQTFQYGNHEND